MKSKHRFYGSLILTCCVAASLIAFSAISARLSILDVAQTAPDASVGYNRAKQAEKIYAFRRERLKRLKPLFEQHSIPLSPEVLAKNNWRRRLAKVFKSMPEMKMTRITGRSLSGIYIADTLILPEKVEASGDTFILANNLIFEGTSPGIQPVGEGSLHVYLIKSDNVRRIKIGRTGNSSKKEQVDGVNAYLGWCFERIVQHRWIVIYLRQLTLV